MSLLSMWGMNDATRASETPRNANAKTNRLAEALRGVSPDVFSEAARKEASAMIERDLRRRTDEANAALRAEWYQINSRQQWEAYRDQRLERLRKSLGEFPPPPAKLHVRVTGKVTGDRFTIENLVYESRRGQWVTGNLYVPVPARQSMPGILIAHSHHRPKTQGELQDMGMTWARAGCLVLVIDQVGHGERRAHPFHSADDFDKEFPVSRQDYYFRYDSGIQLQLAGESLMGWMAWDLMRGVDLLLARAGIDPQRIILLGAVAGGGDPCGVTAALDQRIAATVPFNFGGPQPETRYPMPTNAETWFNYLGGSHWESTRGLRRGGVDGFPHYLIVGSIAPRRLIHAHEFSWDKQRDPVWKRYEKIYGEFYAARRNLSFAHGKGLLSGRPPDASHCTNIGAYHRRMIHPVFQRWFDIHVTPEDEYSVRRHEHELMCMTDDARRELKPKSLVELVSELGMQRASAARQRLAAQPLDQRQKQLRAAWAELLGSIEPAVPSATAATKDEFENAEVQLERIVLRVEPDMVVPLLVLSPSARTTKRLPVVVALAQSGKAALLRHRAEDVATLVQGGLLVCLPDVRGTGETKGGSSRGRTSGDGRRSVNMLLYGETMLGQRLRDLGSVLRYLRTRADVDPHKIALWGDSLAPTNSVDTRFAVPRGVDGRPKQSEPLGGLLALLGALFDDQIATVYVHGGLSSFHSVLTTPYVLVPHDVVVPGVLAAGDICDVAAVLAPRPLYLAETVDGLNRRQPSGSLTAVYGPAMTSYQNAGAAGQLSIHGESTSASGWLLGTLKP